ncbi:MAG: hypothetical protein E6J26_10920, partial [Chloroflexi bacterium]
MNISSAAWSDFVRRCLTTTWSLFILFSFVSAADVTTRASQVEAQSPQTDPTPYFSINWTVLATGHSDTTSGSGTRTVRDRTIRMSGFTVTRKYANGAWDDLPYDLIVNDDFHDVQTSPCSGGGVTDYRYSITNPALYSFAGRDWSPHVYAPYQRPNSSWVIFDPFVDFYACAGSGCYPRLYTYHSENTFTDCNGNTSTTSGSGLSTFYMDAKTPGDIDGDSQGNNFSKQIQFQNAFSQPPLTINWSVTARRLLGRDLTVDRLEVTQGLQDVANSIPLVRGRRTVVRAYLGIG